MLQRTAGSAQTTSRVVERPAWSPAQLLAVVGGVVLVVIGGIALARTGTDFSNIAGTHAGVAGLHYTCLSAVVQLVAGVLLLVAAVRPTSAKSMSAVLGVLALAWGIIVVADLSRLFTTWGYTKSTGVFYIVVGAALLLGGVVSPIFFSRKGEVRTGTGQYVDTASRV